MELSTIADMQNEKDSLEQAAATILGFMLFEYSRLDMSLGLLLAWSNEGKALDKMTKKLNGYSLHKKLELLEKLVDAKFDGIPKAKKMYKTWLVDAHNTRAIRNQLFHGRWGTEPKLQQVVNVIGLPTSPDQMKTPYSIIELQQELESMKSLHTKLNEIRDLWQV